MLKPNLINITKYCIWLYHILYCYIIRIISIMKTWCLRPKLRKIQNKQGKKNLQTVTCISDFKKRAFVDECYHITIIYKSEFFFTQMSSFVILLTTERFGHTAHIVYFNLSLFICLNQKQNFFFLSWIRCIFFFFCKIQKWVIVRDTYIFRRKMERVCIF